MTNSDTNQPLSEAERFAYLQAMDVPIWVSRSQVEDSESNSLTPAEGNPAEEMVSLKEPATQQATTLDSLEAHQEADNQEALTEESTADEHSQDSFEAATVSSDSLSAEDSVEDKTRVSGSQHFLKMVPWKSAPQSPKSLLITCRHQVDQPAQSFARPNAPSQFMADFISAFDSLLGDEGECQVQMGHLSQAGLGQDCSPIDTILSELKPSMMLLLGEETVKELFGPEAKVAEFRGKKLMLNEVQPCVVSYHPFDLIKQPQLKSLALEDLKLLANLINHS